MQRVASVLALSLFASVASATPRAPAAPARRPAAPQAAPAAAAAASAPTERRLFSDSVEASSFLWNDWNRFQENYHPNYLADDDPATGWVEGSDGDGVGEWVRVSVTPLEHTTEVRLRIRNGYQKSKALFRANSRAEEVVIKLLPSGQEQRATLVDKQGWQEVRVAQPPATLRAIEIGIRSVYAGTKYTDLVISDVQVYATSQTRDNPSFEKGKRQSLLEWRKARMAAAKLFRAGKAAELPLYSSYRATMRELSEATAQRVRGNGRMSSMLAAAALEPAFAEWKDAIAAGDGAVASLETLTPAQISPVASSALPEVDGFELQQLVDATEGIVREDALRLPMLGRASAFFADKLRVLDQKGGTPDAYRESVADGSCRKAAAWVQRSKSKEATGPDRVVALLVARCGEVPSREGTVVTMMEQLMVFGRDGRLQLVVGDGYVDGYRWESGGKISGGRSLQYGGIVELTKGQVAAK
ncbi:MAG: hypothetical protein R3B48_13795 [Kofleriaceae bacterium]